MGTSASQAAWPANWVARMRQRAFRTSPADRDPVILRHSRIYILPTRRGFMLMLTLGIMLIASLNYSLSLGLGVTFFVSGLVAAALLHTFRNLAGIKVRPLAAGDTFAGERIAFSVELMGGASARSEIMLHARDTRVVSDVRAGAALTLTLLVAIENRFTPRFRFPRPEGWKARRTCVNEPSIELRNEPIPIIAERPY